MLQLFPLTSKLGMHMAYYILNSISTMPINGRRIPDMGKMRENPRYNVISMRISDEERDRLLAIMEATHKSVSDIMREAMELFSVQLEQSQSTDQKAA